MNDTDIADGKGNSQLTSGTDEVFDIVRDCVMDVLRDVTAHEIRPDVSLRDLGADSLDRLDIVVNAMQKLRVNASTEELGSLANLGALAELLHAKRGAPQTPGAEG